MKISNNPVKYKVLIKQYFRSILDISVGRSKKNTAERKQARDLVGFSPIFSCALRCCTQLEEQQSVAMKNIPLHHCFMQVLSIIFFIVRSNRGTQKLASFGSLNFLYDQNDRNSCTADHMEAAFVNHCHLSEKNLHFTELCLPKIVWRLMKFTIGE